MVHRFALKTKHDINQISKTQKTKEPGKEATCHHRIMINVAKSTSKFGMPTFQSFHKAILFFQNFGIALNKNKITGQEARCKTSVCRWKAI
jgi:hypothetical protein